MSFVNVHRGLFLAVSFIAVQCELSGGVVCYCAICAVSGNSGSIIFTVQYELLLASYVWQCRLLFGGMSYFWQRRVCCRALGAISGMVFSLRSLSCVWQYHLLLWDMS